MMGSRINSHQLSNGLFVSGGRPDQLKDRQPTMSSRAVPYTGGDIKNSGELGKMFDIPNSDQGPPPLRTSRTSSSSSQLNTGPVRSGSGSGPLGGAKSSGSGPIPKRHSGPIMPTGLITSGSISSMTGSRSGQLEPSPSMGKTSYGSVVTNLTEEVKMGFKVSKAVIWFFVVMMIMCLLVGTFLMVAVKNVIFLIAVLAILGLMLIATVWNCSWKKRGLLGFLKSYSESDLSSARDSQCVKVTGVVTCGSIPLETSFQKIPRCVYVSTELLEYKGWGGKSANPKHRCFTWGRRYAERYVTDFYISDFQTGLRALVKAGYGFKTAVLVEPAKILDVTKDNRDQSPSFLQWLSSRSISIDDRVMRLKEGYIKEGSSVSVIGVVRRHDNVLMIVPPPEPISSGCQWFRCLLPTYIEGLVLTCDKSQNSEIIPV
ncbi:uncharacterized membrane protein At1g16860-like [Impatiens glandulifera]|uniref:uncharacterized membrane protein At1g16860-like n=1 Tax=Impatiens glandulifera TaxID=253017 RepID=UPI001FB0B919|nr:uncharacterized membrane protein At1g16860-like [Impatiens glandulifera]